MIFHAKGHPNIHATHKNTLEFTKENHVTPQGDCIVGICADFDTLALAAFVKKHPLVKITITAGGISDNVVAKTNPEFHDDKELVIRLGEHASPRTFAVRADKAAKHLKRELIDKIKQGKEIEVRIEEATE